VKVFNRVTNVRNVAKKTVNVSFDAKLLEPGPSSDAPGTTAQFVSLRCGMMRYVEGKVMQPK